MTTPQPLTCDLRPLWSTAGTLTPPVPCTYPATVRYRQQGSPGWGYRCDHHAIMLDRDKVEVQSL